MGDKITKADLPTEVSEYITALEEKLTDQEDTITKQADAIEDLRDELIDADNDYIVAKSYDSDVLEAAIAKADPDTQGLLRAIVQKSHAAEAQLAEVRKAEDERFVVAKAEQVPFVSSPTEGVTTKDIIAKAYTVSQEHGDQVFAVLKHANTLIEQGPVFDELGQGGGRATVAKSAEAYVAEVRKNDPDMSEEDALADYYSQPGNYDQALEV